jgi:hypothetical protein
MCVRILVFSLTWMVLAGGAAPAQTQEIQDQVNKKLDELRKEQKKDQGSLEELLALALKNNPDIRVAESKLRAADAELYRARMNVLQRIAMLQQQIKSSKTVADEATLRYEHVQQVSARGAISEADLKAALAAMMKARADIAVLNAEMDAITGRNSAKSAALSQMLGKYMTVDHGGDGVVDVFTAGKALTGVKASPGGGSVQGSVSERIRAALESTVKMDIQGDISARDVLDLLRKHTKGINITKPLGTADGEVRPIELTEPIKLGAFFQWAEDQFNWRFIVRDYGIVATERDWMPPGAMLLLELWRKGEPSVGQPATK